jgi:TPP-dependent pyruvate/acetoin dehydrogenase alpha subunit
MLFSTSASSAWLRIAEASARERLPVLLVSCVPAARAALPRRPTPKPTNRFAFPTFNVDGADVVAVYRVASEATVHARNGNGPTLIECVLDSSSDPLKNMENYLSGKGLLDSATKRKVLAELRSELQLNMPFGAA